MSQESVGDRTIGLATPDNFLDRKEWVWPTETNFP
jgi:hypothetical protein